MNLGGGAKPQQQNKNFGGWESDPMGDPFASNSKKPINGGAMNLNAQKKSNIVGDPFGDILGGSSQQPQQNNFGV